MIFTYTYKKLSLLNSLKSDHIQRATPLHFPALHHPRDNVYSYMYILKGGRTASDIFSQRRQIYMNKKIAYLGLFSAVAIIFGYVETLIPVFAGIPGIKLGLANLAVLFILARYTWKEAALVSLIRILVIGFMFGNLFSIAYSIAGESLSLLVMTLLKRQKGFSIVGISIAGGVSHNVGQLLVAMLIVENTSLIYYTPALLVSGVITGLLIGILTSETVRRIP